MANEIFLKTSRAPNIQDETTTCTLIFQTNQNQNLLNESTIKSEMIYEHLNTLFGGVF